MKLYRGERLANGGCAVWVINARGVWRPLNPRLKALNKSPTGFEWGYAGSGPAQLAFALLADVYNIEHAFLLYQRFKFKVIANLDRHEPWQMRDDEIRAHAERLWSARRREEIEQKPP